MKVLTDKILRNRRTPLRSTFPSRRSISPIAVHPAEAEYLRCCPPDHIGSGVTTTDDGRRMVINVEMIGTGSSSSTTSPKKRRPAYCG